MSPTQRSPADDASILNWPEKFERPEKTVQRSHQIPSLLLFGMPGVGKGTQGALMGSMQGLVHVSTGEIFRGLDPASEDGQMVALYINKGELVPDELTGEHTKLLPPVLIVVLRNAGEMGKGDPEMVVVGPKRSDQLHPVFVGTFRGHGALP